MDQDEDTAFADNYAERDQAKVLREQARAGGLRFEAGSVANIWDRRAAPRLFWDQAASAKC